jgi:bifunctional DNA-binding transcriptional regulator/antitoxin component of YhaV-PrlF toxin-antitoxin module
MTTTISADGLIEIPAAFRTEDALQPGQPVEIERTGRGEYRVRVAGTAGPGGQPGDLVSWLLACPEKDWFVEPDRSEMTSLEKPKLFDE